MDLNLELAEKILGTKFMEYMFEKFPGSNAEAGNIILAFAQLKQNSLKNKIHNLESKIESEPTQELLTQRKEVQKQLIKTMKFIKLFSTGGK